MKPVIFIAVAIFLTACTSQPDKLAGAENNFSAHGRKVIVYTTADSTSYRLTATDTLSFFNIDQPIQSQQSIFVDPSHTFQTFIGIGGALTDAAAETFAKLPADKQAELLQAYYDTTRGIGYKIGRTNMNSCDFSSDM